MIYFFVAISFLLFVYRAILAREAKEFLFVFAALMIGGLLAMLVGASYSVMLAGILIFNGIASTYRSRENYLFSLFAVMFIASFINSPVLIAQTMLLGFLGGAHFFSESNDHRAVKLERRRDIVQIIAGIFFVLTFFVFAEQHLMFLIICVVLLGSVVVNYSARNKKSGISKFMYSLERKNAVLGQGALWLALGSLVTISFLSGNQMITVLIAIFVGDSVATLVGTAYGLPLPYNKRKSAYGTAAYFAITASLSFMFIGYIGIAIALVAALVESLPVHFDDNFDTALALTILIKMFYLGLA